MIPPEMREHVRRLADRLNDSATSLADLMADEIGKPIRFGQAEVQRSAQMMHAILARFEAAVATRAEGLVQVRLRPHGLAAVITAWNNPIYLPLGKLVPAILGGNTVAWKPAPEAQAASRHLFALLGEAGWPEGLVRLVEGDGRAASELMNDSAVALVSITGSAVAGENAHSICARRRIPLQAELGGNNASLIWSDADLRDAARQVAAGAFDMAGQRCTANRRAIVHESIAKTFLELLLEESAKLPWGDPRAGDTRIGPLVNAAQRERIAALVSRALPQCKPLLRPCGSVASHARGHEGAWYPPTILCCEDSRAEIVQEETFGPVLVVQTARDWDHAIGLCNDVRQGLVLALFTRSAHTAERFLAEAEAGILKVNQSTADAMIDVPFVGWKASGFGPPEHGSYDVDFYTRPQTIYSALG